MKYSVQRYIVEAKNEGTVLVWHRGDVLQVLGHLVGGRNHIAEHVRQVRSRAVEAELFRGEDLVRSVDLSVGVEHLTV